MRPACALYSHAAPSAAMLRTALRAAVRAPGAQTATRGLATVKLPDLPYDFGALQPVISGEIMQARHVAQAAHA